MKINALLDVNLVAHETEDQVTVLLELAGLLDAGLRLDLVVARLVDHPAVGQLAGGVPGPRLDVAATALCR